MCAAQSGLSGDTNAAQIDLGHLIGGRSSPHVELVDPFVFLFLIADVVSNRGLISISADCRYKITACPEALPCVILFPLPVHPCQVHRALALDESHHRRHSILWRDGNHHVDMVGQKMPLFDTAFLLLGQFAKHLAQVLSKGSVQYRPPPFGDKNNVVLLLPLRVA